MTYVQLRYLLAAISILTPTIVLIRCVAAAEPPTVNEIVALEKELVASKRALRSGEVSLSVRYNTAPAGGGSGRNRSYHMFFKDDKRRADMRADGSPSRGPTVTQRVYSNDVFIRSLGADEAVEFYGPNRRAPRHVDLPDPRLLGFVVWNFETNAQFGLEKHFLRPDRTELRAESGMYNGVPVWHVSYQLKEGDHGSRTDYMLAPDQGNVPVHISVKSLADEPTEMTIDSKFGRFANGEVWYPKQVIYRATVNGKVHTEQVVTVESARFNIDIDDRTFEIAGLGLAVGRAVSSDGKLLRWTGDKLVPESRHFARAEAIQEPNDVWRRWLIGACAVGFGAIALVIAIARWRRW